MNEFKIGLFALIAIVSIIYMSFKVTSDSTGLSSKIEYRTILSDASSIFKKTQVKVAGITSGRIASIELQDDNMALITFNLSDKIKVTQGSYLRLQTVGFLGDKYIEVVLNKESSEILAPLSLIPMETSSGLEQMMKDLPETILELKELVVSVREAIAPRGKESEIKKIVVGINELVSNANNVARSLRRIMEGNEGKIDRLLTNLEDMSRRLKGQFDEDNPEGLMADIDEILMNVKTMTQDLQGVASDLRTGKGTMGQFLSDDKIADEIKETLSSVKKMVSKADTLRTEFEVFSEGGGGSKVAQTSTALRLYTSPERFVHLGVSSGEYGPEKETHYTKIDNLGVETSETKKEKEKGGFSLNFQIGRKIDNFGIRGGLIESKGGLGLDYFVPFFETKFSADVFDYRKGIGFNYRLSSEVRFWNVLYGRVSADDLGSRENRSFLFGGGLKFSDEDIKGIIGLFL